MISHRNTTYSDSRTDSSSRSLSGFVDTARLLTVIQSCRAQGRSILTFFRQALASVHHPLNTVVSLIPTADFALFVNP